MSFVVFGGSIGAVFSGSIAEKAGRKKTIVGANLTMLGAILMLVLFDDISLLCVARIILGFGMGVHMAAGQVYISETAPNELRGPAVSSYILLIFMGFIVSHVASLCFAYELKVMFGLGLVPLVVQLALMLGTQRESPTYVAIKGRPEQVYAILKPLYNTDCQAGLNVSFSITEDAGARGPCAGDRGVGQEPGAGAVAGAALPRPTGSLQVEHTCYCDSALPVEHDWIQHHHELRTLSHERRWDGR